MKHMEQFLSEFSPLPFTLPERVRTSYTVESCLAAREDGASVWRLRRQEDQALFVLKLTASDGEDLEEEARILARVSPCLPGAVPEPVDCFREDGITYFLRTYLPGETLVQWREREDGCTEEQCIALGRQLCALLDVLHRQEPPVIHRDIKPENILQLPDGRPGLLDFGIARQFKDGQDTDTKRMGTRATAAPEQYGYAQTDQRTDLYALGMTLIWLLTGRYDRDGLAQVQNCSAYLRKVLEKAVAFAPEDRYQSATAFAAALGGRSAGTAKRQILAAAAAALVLAAGAWTLWPRETTAELPPETMEAAEDAENVETMETVQPNPETVEFTSAAMEAAVRQALSQPEGPVTYDQLEQIRRLAAVGMLTFGEEQAFDYRASCFVDNQFQGDQPMGDITDVDMALLAHMPNLETLYLCRQPVEDISVLSDLPLTTLALCENEIQDVSPLGSLRGLKTLYLGGNPATDYSALSNLTKLEDLRVEGSGSVGICVVDSLDFLDSLTLRKLGLGLTVPQDGSWEPLTRQIALEELQLWDPNADAVAAANTLVDLKTFGIGDYYAADLTALTGMAGLEVLGIHKGSLESLKGVESLTRLYTLSIGFNRVSDLSPLEGLPQLNYVQLEDLAVTDFSPLNRLPALGVVVVPQAQGAEVEADCPGHTFELRTY